MLKNEKAEEGTFLYYLHEKELFHEESFWDYYNCVISLTANKIRYELEDELVITKAIVYTHSNILKKFIYHLSPNDLYQMGNFPSEKLHLYQERLSIMLHGYFEGFVLEEDLFDEDLTNPKNKY